MSIEELLDQLAEFQAQRDLLEINKNDLLNSVKVPDEVLAAQADANKRRQAIDSEWWNTQKEIHAAEQSVLDDLTRPELPAEYLEAMTAYQAEVEAARSQATARIEAEQKKTLEAKSKIDAELQAQTAQVYANLENRKAEIQAEFGDKASAVDANIAKLTDQIKRETATYGKSVKGKVFHAVYVKGRVTWETDKLDGMCALIPQLREARKEGAPSVTIRKI